MKVLIIAIVGTLLVTPLLPTPSPATEPVATVEEKPQESIQIENSSEPLKEETKPEPKPAPVKKEEPKTYTSKENPNNCDLGGTEVMWPDGSCHEIVIPDGVTVNSSIPPKADPTEQIRASQAVSGDCYAALLSQYDWNVATMQRIMRAESGCNPTNHNWGDRHATCTGSYGLLQIGCIHGYSASAMASPAANIAAGYKIWKSQGYTAWTTY